MPRLLNILHSAAPQTGGPGEYIRQVTPLLAAKGWESTLITLDAPAITERHQIEGLSWQGIGPSPNFYGYTGDFLSQAKAAATAHDAVILHSLWNYPTLAGSWAARAVHKPYWIYPHGTLDPWFNRASRLKMFKKHLTWWWGERRTLRHAQAVWFTSPTEAALAPKAFPAYRARSEVLPFGVTQPPPASPAQTTAVQSRIQQTKTKRQLLFLSRVHPKKGLDLLLKAWRDPTIRPTDTTLWIAGDGDASYISQLKALLPANDQSVQWLGWVQGGTKTAWLEAADALILPSHQENFGLVVAEALAVGTPVLLTHAVNIARTVVDAHAGFAAKDDPAGIASLLKLFADEPATIAQFRAQARACYATQFALAATADAVDTQLRASLWQTP